MNFEKINKYSIWALSIFFLLFGFRLWDKIIFKVYLKNVGHIHKSLLLILGLVWTFSLIVFLCTNKKSRLKLYYALILFCYTSLYQIWLVLWGFPLGTPFSTLGFYFFLFAIVGLTLITILIFYTTMYLKPISHVFSRKYMQDILIFILFFSMIFLISIDVYDTRNPEDIHQNYFSDRNMFPPDHRILVPSFIETSKMIFEKLQMPYLAKVQRLYKAYLIPILLLAFYLYYLFLTKFLKKTTALLASIILLSMFYFSFRVGGLVDDPFNLLAFVIGLILIYYKKDIYLWLLVFIASFNKETIWLLVFMYFVYNFQFITKKNWWRLFGKTTIMALTFFGVMLFRIILKPIHGTDFNWIIYNFTCEQCVLHVFLILNIFWILSFFFAEYPKQLKFFSRLNFVTPFFVAWHYFGLIREIRFFVIIGLILVPLGLSLLFPDSVLKKEELTEVQ